MISNPVFCWYIHQNQIIFTLIVAVMYQSNINELLRVQNTNITFCSHQNLRQIDLEHEDYRNINEIISGYLCKIKHILELCNNSWYKKALVAGNKLFTEPTQPV